MNFKQYLGFLIEGIHGSYAGVRFDAGTIRDLILLQKTLGIPNPLAEEKFHSTLLFSRKPLPNYVAFGEYPVSPASDSNTFELRIFKTQSGKNALVLAYECSFLQARHKELMDEHGATWDHPSYIPHITLSYDIGDYPVTLGPIQFLSERRIVIVNEYQEDLNLDWK